MLDKEATQRAFDQAMDVWINPEIEKRKQRRWLKEDFELRAAQVVFTPGKSPQIKFNDKIKIVAKVKANRDVIKGEAIRYSDLKSIEEFIIDYPKDSGHITIFKLAGNWIFVFDARYNKAKIVEFVEASREAFQTAEDSLQKGRLRSFFESCWISAELCSACHSLILGQNYANHRQNLQNFEDMGRLKNIDENHPPLLKKLKGLRGSARYLGSPEFKSLDPEEILEGIKKMIEEAEKLVKYDG